MSDADGRKRGSKGASFDPSLWSPSFKNLDGGLSGCLVQPATLSELDMLLLDELFAFTRSDRFQVMRVSDPGLAELRVQGGWHSRALLHRHGFSLRARMFAPILPSLARPAATQAAE